MDRFEQISIKEEPIFPVSPEDVLANFQRIKDFFVDNELWALELKKGGSTYGRINIDEVEITDSVAATISKFFLANEGAQKDLLRFVSKEEGKI